MLTPSSARARAAAPALLASIALAATVLLAGPAGAQQAPVSGGVPPAQTADDDRAATSPVDTFRAVVHALDRLRAEASATTAERAEAAQVARFGCVEAGTSNDIPRVVADIFRCRLLEAGVDEAEAKRIATEAVVVSHCESKWDPNAVVFGGRYREHPHPNGNRYTAAGVFQIIERVANDWVDGGYARVTDPRRNIDAAARLYLRHRALGYGGWGEWACAASNDGFQGRSVLPGWPGGPAALPEWAAQYVA